MEVYDDDAPFTNTLSGNEGAVSYTSENEDVATVNANGQVTVVGVGTTKITATAAAIDDYEETIKSYTLTVWPTTINGIKGLVTETSAGSANAFKARLTDAYITYSNDRNAFLQDGSGAILIYKSGHGLTPGDCFNGVVSGTAFKYNGLNEINSFDFSAAAKTTITVPAPQVVTMAELSESFDAYESRYLQLKGVTAGEDIAAVNKTCKLTQDDVEYTSPVLRAAAAITSVKAGNTYDIIVFPGYYNTTNTTEQLNLWTDDHVTKVAGAPEVPTVAFGQDNYTAAFGESVELTFTTNSDGEVTYTATPAEGITLTKTETGVTAIASKADNYTITATVAATDLYAEASASCLFEVTKKAPEATMTIDPAEVEFGSTSTLTFRMKKGEATTGQVTIAEDGTEAFADQLSQVTWTEEGDSYVATINLTAPSRAAEYTFTATVPETDNYKSATASATLKVVAPSHNLTPTVLYKQITSMDEFVDGGVYLLGCERYGDAAGAINGTGLGASNSISIQIGQDANGNEFKYYQGEVNANKYPYEITITKAENGTYNLYLEEGKYINGTGNNSLSFDPTGNAGWSISFVETTGNVKISHNKFANAYLQRNTGGTAYYKNYKGTVAVQLYQKVGEINVHSKMKGYSTYVADFPYVMPAGLTGKTVSVDAAGQLTVTDLFEGGNEVPALTPLLVRTADTYAEGEEKKVYYPAVLNKEVTVVDNVSEELANSNLEYRRKLVSGKLWTSTLDATLVNPYYYKLSVDTEGQNPGFYWGATDGSAFEMKNGSTAYLTCSSAVRVNKFIFDENGETTAVEGVLTDGNMPADAVVYNLQGIRVNPKNLQKGIYIVNGRKTVVK